MGWIASLIAVIQALTCTPDAEAAQTLRALDHRRAVSFATADMKLLTDVYAPGAAVLRIDRHRLLTYSRAGIRMRGMEMVTDSCRVIVDTADTKVLRVTDRLLPTRAVFADGTHRLLPTDHPSAREIELRRLDGRWLIRSVTSTQSAH